MDTKLQTFNQTQTKKDLPDIRPGDTVRVMQKIKEGDKERIQTFEGLVLTRKHKKELGATIAVKKIISGIGVEKTFPLHSPAIERIEIIKRGKVRRAKLYYLRRAKGKKAKLKQKELVKNKVAAEKEPEKKISTEVKKTNESEVKK